MIICRSQAEIERMRVANQLVAEVLAALEAAVAPGVTTGDLTASPSGWFAKVAQSRRSRAIVGIPRRCVRR